MVREYHLFRATGHHLASPPVALPNMFDGWYPSCLFTQDSFLICRLIPPLWIRSTYMDCIASRPPDKPFQYRIALRYFCASQAHVHNPRAHTLLMLFEAVHAAILQGMDPNLPITSELHCFEYQETFDHQTPCLSN